MFTSDYYPDCLYEIWEYGDESTTYGRPINHSYQSHGNYTVSHKVVFKDSVAKCNHVIAIEWTKPVNQFWTKKKGKQKK